MDEERREIKEFQEKNLDNAEGWWTHEKTLNDRNRKRRRLAETGHLKQEIIQTRMLSHEYGLNAIQDKIQGLQDERTAILLAPMNKKEFLKEAKDLIHLRKKEALNEFVFMPLATKKEGNLGPRLESTGIFPERRIWDLLYLAISDEDLEAVVAGLPDTGLSKAERKAKVKEINTEIEGLTTLLNEELGKAKKDLKERNLIE